jgi:predicted transcriptional regulator
MAINETIPEKRKSCFSPDEMIAKLRHAMKGRTQKEFADSIGISQPMLSQILNKERLPSEEVLKRLKIERVDHYESA